MPIKPLTSVHLSPVLRPPRLASSLHSQFSQFLLPVLILARRVKERSRKVAGCTQWSCWSGSLFSSAPSTDSRLKVSSWAAAGQPLAPPGSSCGPAWPAVTAVKITSHLTTTNTGRDRTSTLGSSSSPPVRIR